MMRLKNGKVNNRRRLCVNGKIIDFCRSTLTIRRGGAIAHY
jgi:hypothetical protein